MVLHLIRPARHFERRPVDTAPWSFERTHGQVIELSGQGAFAPLSSGFWILRQLQEAGEPVAWVGRASKRPFVPDLLPWHLDLEAIAFIFPSRQEQMGRAADVLLASGAFGGVVLDLDRQSLPLPLLTRLAARCARHESCLVLLSEKSDESPSMGVGISWRSGVQRQRIGPNAFVLRWQGLKDRQGGAQWCWHQSCQGVPGCP
ncbi:MAG TPA: hypothetical protein DEB46_14930 [Myxococcales bacterium]|nr:hypothetical protein [Myxococcales bacterium]HBU49597.1 hypothetical protein [Myxococcales bacterium]|tara:strand:- start:757 stop:1365 length:609 start_codon:yes stop_codon:yes gene_type:complete